MTGAERDRAPADQVFKALGDPTRRGVLRHLADGELAVGQIVDRFSISGPSISRHLAILKAAGLVAERRDANRVLYSIVPGPLALHLQELLAAVGATAPLKGGPEAKSKGKGKRAGKGPAKKKGHEGRAKAGKPKDAALEALQVPRDPFTVVSTTEGPSATA